MHAPLPVLFIALILVGMVVGALVRGVRRLSWVQGEAEVTGSAFNQVRFDEGATGSHLYVVRAAVITPDGERHPGQARDFYGEDSQAWVGTRRTAWYDPRRPERFTLTPPLRQRGIGGGDVVVYAVFALIAAVVLAVILL